MLSITIVIVAVNVIVSLICFNDREKFNKLLLNPYTVKRHKQWYRVLTHAFVHADYLHLFFNMWVLWMFGTEVEKRLIYDFGAGLGPLIYVLLYIGGIGFSVLPAFQKHSDNVGYSAVGASGAVSAVLFAAIILSPAGEGRAICLYGILCMQPFIFGALYIAFEMYMDKRGKGNIAHDAHIWGALFGIAFLMLIDFDYMFSFTSQISDYISNF